MNEQQHRTYGVPVEWRGKPGTAAVCKCGWQGPNRYGPMQSRRAYDDAAEHRGVFMGPVA